MNQKRLLYVCTMLVVLVLMSACVSAEPVSQQTGASIESMPEMVSSSTASTASSSSASSAPVGSSSSQAVALPFDAPERWQEPLPIGLIGGWYGGVSVGAGYAERYLFLEDGTFFFAQSQNAVRNRLCYMDGEWSYIGGTVQLTVKRKIMLEGGRLDTSPPYPPEGAIVDGTYVQIELPENEYEILELPLEIIPADEELESYYGIPGSIILGDLQLYLKGGVGHEEMPTLWDYYGSL